MSNINFKEWLETNIELKHINFFNYYEFTGVKKIGEGGFGEVKSAEWPNRGLIVALKRLRIDVTLDNNDIEEFVRELKLLRKVYYHPNINRFYGVTKDPELGHYIMVLKYADDGNLQSYLKEKFTTLTLSVKIRMAMDISRGLMCLHTEDIIHRDLHDGNILVNQGRLMISDLGLSKELNSCTISSRSTLFGVPAYIEPQCFKDDKYKRDKRSDIYGLGHLLWEIFSGYPPFKSFSKYVIPSKVLSGERELPIKGTPQEYVELYQQCWDTDPKKRPEIQHIFNCLEEISSKFDTAESLTENKNDLNVQNSNISGEDDNILNEYETIENHDIIPIVPNHIFNTENDFVRLLVELVRSYSINCRFGSFATLEKYSNLIKNNQSVSEKLFHFVKNTSRKIAHKELIMGIFYKEAFGTGTDPNRKKQFKWMDDGARKKDIFAIYELGHCYKRGYGVEKNFNKAFKFYKKAADMGLNKAKFSVAKAYRFGMSVDPDETEAFNLYKELVAKGYVGAIYELAQCYEYKVGTAANNKEALRLYKLYFQSGFPDNNNKVKELERTIRTSQDGFYLV